METIKSTARESALFPQEDVRESAMFMKKFQKAKVLNYITLFLGKNLLVSDGEC